MTSLTRPETPASRQDRFESLVLPHLDRLLGFALRRTVARSDAEDIVQEMCVRAWQAFDELRDVSRIRPWLFRILRTVISDELTRAKRRQRLVPISRLEDVHETQVATDKEGVFADLVARIDVDMLCGALQEIPDDFASVIELHDLEGFKYQEIAEMLEIPIGTVMSRISRGRRLLAGVIAERHAEWALGVPRDQKTGLPFRRFERPRRGQQ